MIEKQKAKKLMSIGTYQKLTDLLYTLEHVTSKKEVAKEREELRKFISRLFSYADICELHDDQVLEIAEVLVGLYPEADDLDDYVYHILIYLEKQIEKQEHLCAEYKKKLNRKARERDKDPYNYLNLIYQTWVYTDGYKRQKIQMYHLLQHTLNDLKQYAKRGELCKKKKRNST